MGFTIMLSGTITLNFNDVHLYVHYTTTDLDG